MPPSIQNGFEIFRISIFMYTLLLLFMIDIFYISDLKIKAYQALSSMLLLYRPRTVIGNMPKGRGPTNCLLIVGKKPSCLLQT